MLSLPCRVFVASIQRFYYIRPWSLLFYEMLVAVVTWDFDYLCYVRFWLLLLLETNFFYYIVSVTSISFRQVYPKGTHLYCFKTALTWKYAPTQIALEFWDRKLEVITFVFINWLFQCNIRTKPNIGKAQCNTLSYYTTSNLYLVLDPRSISDSHLFWKPEIQKFYMS